MSLSDYSNIKTVNEKAKELYINNTVKPSARKDKKYMIVDDIGKYIHFGQLGYEDYINLNTKIMNEEKVI